MDFFGSDVVISDIQLAVEVPCGSGVKTHRNRSSHGIVMEIDGRKKYVFSDGSSIVIGKNEIGYLPKHSYYSVEILVPGDCYAINFNLCGQADYPPSVVKTEDSSYFTHMFKYAAEQWRLNATDYSLKMKSCLYEVLFQIYKESSTGSYLSLSSIQPALAYIQQNYCRQQIRVPYLAQLCRISGTALRKKFVKELGLSPLQYIIKKKMMYAGELLCSDMYSVKEVQFTCGYEDASTFSRDFKRFFGCAPSVYNRGTN